MEEDTLQYKTLPVDENITLRYLYAFSKPSPRAVVLLLNGRSECLEKYKEVIAELLARNFDVATFDWRGQGFSTRELENRHKGHVKDFSLYIRDLEMFYHRVVKERHLPVILLGHSMGAHVGLRFIRENPGVVARAVVVSPMIDIRTRPLPCRFVRLAAELACFLGFSKRYVIGGKDFSGQQFIFEKNKLTHDSERFVSQLEEIRKQPDLAVGDVTWAWLAAAFRSIDTLSRRPYARGITVPLLLVSAAEDLVVDRSAQENICRMIPGCSFVSLAGAYHEVLMEKEAIRERFWHCFDNFVSG